MIKAKFGIKCKYLYTRSERYYMNHSILSPTTLLPKVLDTERCINEKLVELHDGSTKAVQSNESNEETTTEQPHDELLNPEISENNEPTSMNQALSTSQLSQATEGTGTVNQSNLINTESLTPVLPQTRSKLPKLILPKFRGEITQ